MGFRIRVGCMLAVCLAVAGAASGQTTGSISGGVFDQNGMAITGAGVRVVGDAMPAGRSTTTDDNGTYQVTLLLPGAYTVEVTKPAVGTSKRTVLVELAKDTQVDLVLGLNVQEAVSVTAITPSVDMKSTQVNFNYSAQQIQALPLGRSYAGLFQLIPGVADNNSFAPSGGASRQDNKYLMDGVDITNPGFGYLSTEVNELDIVEFNVKRGAITAEFGRATGFVTNAVSKSGTNQLHGAVRSEVRPKTFEASDRAGLKSSTDRYVTAFSVGGPIARDRVFWYGSGQYNRTVNSNRSNNLGPLPDQKPTAKEIFGKVTVQPSNSMFVNGSYRHRPNDCLICGIGLNEAPEVATDTVGNTGVGTLAWNWFPTGRTVVDVKVLHMEENAASVARTDLGFRPAFNVNALATMGLFTDQGVTRGGASIKENIANYRRDEVRATVSQYFDLGGTTHQMKAGFGYERGEENLTRKANGWGSVTIVQAGTQVQARYYPDQPAQISPGRTYSLFVQDDISIGRRFVINAGVLVNKDEFSQKLASENTFLSFGFGDEIQPRVGINYALRSDGRAKIYGNYGRYYAMDQKSSSRSLAPSRLYLNSALFNRTTGALISDLPDANTTGKRIDPGLRPTYTDEVLVGYATELHGVWSLDAVFMYRNSSDFIEDVPTSLPATGPFHAAQLVNATRKYKALLFELTRRVSNRWNVTASYGWSRLEGNFDLDYAAGSVFNTSSAIQDGPGEFVEDRFRYGPLGQDRPHIFKLFTSYTPAFWDGLTLGGYVRAQSGAPWSARGRDWDNGFRRYLEPAGSRRVDPWTNVDVLAAYRVKAGTRAGVKIEGRLLNLFDNQAVLSVDSTQYNDGRVRPAVAAFAPCGTDYACATDLFSAAQTTTQPNPLFGTGTTFAASRRFILTFVLDF